MERQKVFWVVLSVSVFVVVVLVVGVFLLRQRPVTTSVSAPGTVSPIADPGTRIYEYQNETPLSQGNQPQGDTETLRFYIGEGEGTTPPSTQDQAPPTSPPPATGTAGASPAPASTPKATPSPKAVTVNPAPTRKAAPAGPEYWIQTGSYKSQSKAEELAGVLSNKGLSGRLFSYAAGSDTYFRVRVGPYTNKGEAEKFLVIVRKLQGLEASYISQVRPVRNPVNLPALN